MKWISIARKSRMRQADKYSDGQHNGHAENLDLRLTRRCSWHQSRASAGNVSRLKRRNAGSDDTAFLQRKTIPTMSVAHGQSDQGVQTVFSLFVEIARYHGKPFAMIL